MRAIFIGGPKHGDVELIGHAPSRFSFAGADGEPAIYRKGSMLAGGQAGELEEVWYIIDGMTTKEALQQVKTINLPRIG